MRLLKQTENVIARSSLILQNPKKFILRLFLLVFFNHKKAEDSEDGCSADCHHRGDDDVFIVLFTYRHTERKYKVRLLLFLT